MLAEENNGSLEVFTTKNLEFDHDSLTILLAPLDQQYSTPSLTLVSSFSMCAKLLGKLP